MMQVLPSACIALRFRNTNLNDVKSSNMSTRFSRQTIDEKLYLPNINFNVRKLQRFQDVISLSLGIAAGAMGYESFDGLAFYSAGLMIAYLSFFVVCCRSQPHMFFVSPGKEAVNGYLTSLAGFVMMWCLTYALVK